jgi:hypothetical protein
LFDELVTFHAELHQTFPLLITVRLARWFGRHGHLAFN